MYFVSCDWNRHIQTILSDFSFPNVLIQRGLCSSFYYEKQFFAMWNCKLIVTIIVKIFKLLLQGIVQIIFQYREMYNKFKDPYTRCPNKKGRFEMACHKQPRKIFFNKNDQDKYLWKKYVFFLVGHEYHAIVWSNEKFEVNF